MMPTKLRISPVQRGSTNLYRAAVRFDADVFPLGKGAPNFRGAGCGRRSTDAAEAVHDDESGEWLYDKIQRSCGLIVSMQYLSEEQDANIVTGLLYDMSVLAYGNFYR